MVLYRPRSVAISYRLLFSVCVFLELLGDGAVEVVAAGNGCIYEY